MVAGIAPEIILQPLKVLPEQKLEKISKKPEITSSAKIIIEDIYKTCFEQKRIT